jgi:hypothetical protein
MTELWTPTPPDPPKPSNSASPLIGMAICACLFVVTVLAGLVSLCGGINIVNGSQSTSSVLAWAAGIIAIGSFLGGIGCFVWFIVRLVSNSRKG